MLKKRKPLVRWVIGDVRPCGFSILKKSTDFFVDIYRDRFDYEIHYNGPTTRQKLDKFSFNSEIEIVKQVDSKELNVRPPTNVDYAAAWKLYPARARLYSHEIIIDNDLVLEKPLEEIEEFLASEHRCMITEAYRRNFGRFDRLIPKNLKFNTGFCGLHPGFDLTAKINSLNVGEWMDYFDEQGATSASLFSDGLIVIPLSKISVCVDNWISASHGSHFVGANKGWVSPWEEYLKHKNIKTFL